MGTTTSRKTVNRGADVKRAPSFTALTLPLADSAQRDALDRAGLEVTSYMRPARTTSNTVSFNNFVASHIRTGPVTMVWHRTTSKLRRRYLFILVNHGSVEIDGARLESSPGSGSLGVVLPGSEDVRLTVLSEVEAVAFSFDSHEVAPLTLAEHTPVARPADAVFFRAAYGFFAQLLDATAATRDARPAGVLSGLMRSFARSFMLQLSPGGDGSRQDLAELVVSTIAREYQSPTFTALDLAREIGVSRRSLERACESVGLSIADELRKRRAEQAHGLLLERPTLPLSTVRSLSGFSSNEALRRAVVRYYGATPSALRGTPAAAAS